MISSEKPLPLIHALWIEEGWRVACPALELLASRIDLNKGMLHYASILIANCTGAAESPSPLSGSKTVSVTFHINLLCPQRI